MEDMTSAAISVPFEAIQVILEFAPGSWSPVHSHGGPVLITVLEGEITYRPEATGEEIVYRAGDFWTEEAGALHVAGNAGQENVRVAALYLVPEGASMTTVAEVTPTVDPPPGPTIVSRTSMTVTTVTE
jgi:quercetin dioxygenase-like cupin family protein